MSSFASDVPTTGEEILARVGPRGRLVFEAVRGVVDDLEKAAPWTSLYSPTDDQRAFLTTQRTLLEVIEGIPARVQTCFEEIDRHRGPEDPGVGELAAFFDTTFIIISRDRDRLTEAVANAADGSWTRDRRQQICQVAADLKGKYQSALMGVAGKIIAQGRWSGVEVEPVLFSEKREEFERNHELVEQLELVTNHLRELTSGGDLAEVLEHWRADERADRYALVDLTIVVAELGKLLKEDCRRALYSGDYHQIQSHERELSARVNKLQIIHEGTWTESAKVTVSALFPRLVDLLLEISAILDLHLLKALLGEERYGAVRDRAQSTPVTHPPAEGDLESKLSWLIQAGSLRTFLEALTGNVRKRESLVAERTTDAAPPSADQGRGRAEVRRVLASLLNTERPQWQAFVAAQADPRAVPVLAMELRRELAQRLVPLLVEVEDLAQFGTVLGSTLREIRSSSDRTPMQTVLRLLNRLEAVLEEPDGPAGA